jgi:tetratricopeptide (TPR) repeat protein
MMLAALDSDFFLARNFLAVLLTILLLFVLFPPPALAQATAPQPQAAVIPDAKDLNEAVLKYEQFLANPPDGTSGSTLTKARTQLATDYFLLHRYRESLQALRPLHIAESAEMPAQAWSIKGLDELKLNQLADAIKSLRHAVAASPSGATARLALGDALARSGRMQDAASEYTAQTRLTPTLPDAWYKLGLAHSQISVEVSHATVESTQSDILQQLIGEDLIAKGDNLDAARVLFRILHHSPNQPEVHADLATALLALGYVKAAEEHFRQELVKNPESPSAQLGLVQTGALAGDWNLVGKTIENLSRKQPVELTRLLQFPAAGLIIDAWNGGRMDPPQWFTASDVGKLWKTWVTGSEVIAQIRPATDKTSKSCPAKLTPPGMWLTEVCYQTLETRLRASKQRSSIDTIKLAEAEFRLGHYDAALHTATLLRTSAAHSAWGIYWLSKTHDALAEECFLKVGALNPNSARVHQMLAEHYTKLSDYTRARMEFESALRLAPQLAELHLGLGTVLSRTGTWPEAENELKKALELAPESDFAHYQLGHVYVQQQAWQPAIEQLRHVPSGSSELLSTKLDLSKAESETEQTAAAVQDLLSVAALDHDGEVYFRLAPLYRKLGDDAHAREALATFKKMRAASLETDKDELSALEQQQVPAGLSSSP